MSSNQTIFIDENHKILMFSGFWGIPGWVLEEKVLFWETVFQAESLLDCLKHSKKIGLIDDKRYKELYSMYCK